MPKAEVPFVALLASIGTHGKNFQQAPLDYANPPRPVNPATAATRTVNGSPRHSEAKPWYSPHKLAFHGLGKAHSLYPLPQAPPSRNLRFVFADDVEGSVVDSQSAASYTSIQCRFFRLRKPAGTLSSFNPNACLSGRVASNSGNHTFVRRVPQTFRLTPRQRRLAGTTQ